MFDIPLLKAVFPIIRLGYTYEQLSNTLGLGIPLLRRIKALPSVNVLLESDMHCGHVAGLTPPDYQLVVSESAEMTHHNKWARHEKEIWEWRAHIIDTLKPIDVHIHNGDAVDGKGHITGGTEELTTEVLKQCDMAVECLRYSEASCYYLTFGSAYHSGDVEDFEQVVASKLHAKIGSHDWLEFNHCVLDLKHHQSNTKNPYTSLQNEIDRNREWSINGEQPLANVLIRSHTHRFHMCQSEGILGISTPALQGYGSKFGARKCVFKVHIGLIFIKIWPDGYPEVHPFIADLGSKNTSIEKNKSKISFND